MNRSSEADDGSLESWLGDADDSQRIGVDLNGLADDRRVGGEGALPESIRNHNQRMFARRDVIGWFDRAAEPGSNPQH
jgi:hypothetical protein